MEKLFDEFKEIDVATWVDKIYADLKDKPKELLTFEPELGLKFKAHYHRDEAQDGLYGNGRLGNDWTHRKIYTNHSNSTLLKDLNEGINHLSIAYQDLESFSQLTKDVQFEHIKADVKFTNLKTAIEFNGPNQIELNFDVIGLGLAQGKWSCSTTDFLNFYREKAAHKTIWVSGYIYGEAGASSVQELAYTAAHINEYLHLLHNEGVPLSEINDKLIVELSITDDYFTNIAKYRLITHITAQVFQAYQADYQLKPFQLIGRSSSRYMAQNDHNNNLLRQTTMAMSAIIGGCDALSIIPFSTGDKEKDEVLARMAKNIPLVLQEESYLDKVADPSEGAYFIEELCDQLNKNAWELFKEIEDKGGLIESVNSNWIQTKIKQHQSFLINQINEKKDTFLGVNKHPSTLEEWKVIQEPSNSEGEEFNALTPFRLESHYKKAVHEQS